METAPLDRNPKETNKIATGERGSVTPTIFASSNKLIRAWRSFRGEQSIGVKIRTTGGGVAHIYLTKKEAFDYYKAHTHHLKPDDSILSKTIIQSKELQKGLQLLIDKNPAMFSVSSDEIRNLGFKEVKEKRDLVTTSKQSQLTNIQQLEVRGLFKKFKDMDRVDFEFIKDETANFSNGQKDAFIKIILNDPDVKEKIANLCEDPNFIKFLLEKEMTFLSKKNTPDDLREQARYDILEKMEAIDFEKLPLAVKVNIGILSDVSFTDSQEAPVTEALNKIRGKFTNEEDFDLNFIIEITNELTSEQRDLLIGRIMKGDDIKIKNKFDTLFGDTASMRFLLEREIAILNDPLSSQSRKELAKKTMAEKMKLVEFEKLGFSVKLEVYDLINPEDSATKYFEALKPEEIRKLDDEILNDLFMGHHKLKLSDEQWRAIVGELFEREPKSALSNLKDMEAVAYNYPTTFEQEKQKIDLTIRSAVSALDISKLRSKKANIGELKAEFEQNLKNMRFEHLTSSLQNRIISDLYDKLKGAGFSDKLIKEMVLVPIKLGRFEFNTSNLEAENSTIFAEMNYKKIRIELERNKGKVFKIGSEVFAGKETAVSDAVTVLNNPVPQITGAVCKLLNVSKEEEEELVKKLESLKENESSDRPQSPKRKGDEAQEEDQGVATRDDEGGLRAFRALMNLGQVITSLHTTPIIKLSEGQDLGLYFPETNTDLSLQKDKNDIDTVKTEINIPNCKIKKHEKGKGGNAKEFASYNVKTTVSTNLNDGSFTARALLSDLNFHEDASLEDIMKFMGLFSQPQLP